MIYLFLFILFFVIILFYFKVAKRYKIIDKPNERSSHTSLTIRGGGILFLVSIIAAGIIYPSYYLPVMGASIIGIISFVDDRVTLSSKIRIVFHLAAVSILFYFLPIFGVFPIWAVFVLYILVIGIINAYNFMDGINGITGVYSFVVLTGLQYVNLKEFQYIEPDLIWIPLISIAVFLFFNFRKRAKCFAGDVGSVTIAFWILFLMLKLILETGNWVYILFLAVYGVDSVLTIMHRLSLKHNIFDAHRLHFYQILANERKVPHLFVATGYGVVQLIVIWFVLNFELNLGLKFLIAIFPLVVIYFMKFGLMKIKS